MLLVAFLLVNAPNCHISLVLASVVQGDAVNCKTMNLIKIKKNDNRTQDCYLRTITSCHPSKIAAKYQQKSYEYYLRDNHVQEVDVTRSTHDRKRI